MGKTFKIQEGDMSDGYHTFNELYEHRNALWINYCLTRPSKCYWVSEHYPGWDLLVMQTNKGQVSYHVPTYLREVYCKTIKNIPLSEHKFDGHTPGDVLKRLRWCAEEEPEVKDER